MIWMFYRKLSDKGNNLVDNPNIYNVEEDNKLSPGLQPLTTDSVFKIYFLQSGSVIVYFILENILLSTTVKF